MEGMMIEARVVFRRNMEIGVRFGGVVCVYWWCGGPSFWCGMI